MLRRVGAVQLDTISVLARSHELVACARLGAVGRERIEDAYWGQPARAFEYYAHAACVLPIEAWPYFAFRRRAFQAKLGPVGASKTGTSKVIGEVRARLREGPATATDVGGARTGMGGWWSWSDAKMALEALYMRGEAICTTRSRWKRVYDLPERVLPPELLAHEPSDAECYAYLVRCAGRALGIGTRRDIAGYYRLTMSYVGMAANANVLVDEAIAESGLVPVSVEGWDDPAFVDPAALAAVRRERHRTTLLSPFDSAIWERQRTQRMFGFTLSLEAYKPKEQRIHGYFSMPLLADGRLVGRVDPAREGKTLVARTVVLDDAASVQPMAEALREAASWVACDNVRIENVMPRAAARALRKALA
jgi:uncharacterized protein YcaQ